MHEASVRQLTDPQPVSIVLARQRQRVPCAGGAVAKLLERCQLSKSEPVSCYCTSTGS